jgi:deoxyribodipyrimidine photo-lyase
MKSILWFRRDLRINDNAILSYAKGEVLPIFIFDTDILEKLPSDDKRVTFIYKSVLQLKSELKSIGLDLAMYHGKPKEIFEELKKQGFDEVLCSCDFDAYAIKRDKEIEKILHVRRFYDSYLLEPSLHVKSDGTPYKVFTPFYNSLSYLWQSDKIEELKPSKSLKLVQEDFPLLSLEEIGFFKQQFPSFLEKDARVLLDEFREKLLSYKEQRDYFALDASSKLSVHLRFGLISPKEVFNSIKKENGSDFFIRELFWREFYTMILYHFPKSEFTNFNGYEVTWRDDTKDFDAWCEGKTGYPLIDAAMQHLNFTGLMHNRLRMVVASFLCKNLLIDWRWGEAYFAQKLLDYEASSNIGSWQWAASTGADSVPYFRIFNPLTQSEKFDKEALFIKSVFPHLQEIEAKLFHKEGALSGTLLANYPKPIISLSYSRVRAIETFKKARNERD